ncbi:MAG: response regulator transcription factor [Candidatus Aminicenantes bacterium]|nr:MAG: response regulator transcription factor [Candidatus Aminicenantes bacterium]
MTKILIVEDDKDIALGLEEDLTNHGFQVEAVEDGEKALSLGKKRDWDLIILDIMLPRKDGFTICQELRRVGIKTPIIMLTAKTHEAEKIFGLEIGADDYITKPFSPRELRARIHAVLRRVPEKSRDTYKFGEYEVDFGRGEVRRSGKPIYLTALEFRLLTVFIQRRGRVLSREQLIDAAWGSTTIVTERVVDTHILNLRRKIESVPAKPCYICSVRGMGYRFEG